jgi:chromosome segregation ATPase
MAMRNCVLLALLAVAFASNQHRQQDALESGANPIRRVVTLLQNMAKKIAVEAEKEKELYDKYMCYCKTAGGTLQGSIDAAGNKIPQVESALKEAEEQKTQLEQDVKDAQAARAEAKSSMAKATAIREKEAAEFAKEKAEYDTNIGQLSSAITAIEKGMTGFLQTKTAAMVKRLALNSDLSNFDRNLLMSFLEGGSKAGYVPQSGEIVGILKEMHDTMEKDLADITATEKTAIADFDSLMAAKTKEVHACTKAIETKSARVGELGVSIAMMKNDLDDTSAALLEDKKFLADMDSTCASKEKEWDSIKKARAEETVAIQETIKILNDDDALELFKKTLPSSSLLQTVAKFDSVKRKALALVQELQQRPIQQRSRIDLISLALSGRKVSFEKVIKMIDDMVGILGKEQADDDDKKEYCEKQLDVPTTRKRVCSRILKISRPVLQTVRKASPP